MKSQTRGLANAANTTYHIWPFFLNLKSYFTINWLPFKQVGLMQYTCY